MFDITPEDIARLDDEQLREVVARLCEAELRRVGFSSSFVTAGGDQNATDGGIDVRVSLPPEYHIEGYVRSPVTGFQARRTDMPRAKILEEMRPDGSLRPSIQALAEQSGAYIIVSSLGSTADTALTDRRNAMREALVDAPHASSLITDFYDRTRIASWVRSHEGLIPWVRRLVGRTIPGWYSHGAWAYSQKTEYLLDDKLRIRSPRLEKDGLSSLEGIEKIRSQLREPRKVIRLIGFSGVGKTSIVQALFDERVGHDALDPSLAFYANMSDSPDPHPTALASDLIAAHTRAILLIDNCPAELHQRLTELCRQDHSDVSVLTVEYDIQDGQPEATEVFRLDVSSPELVQRVLAGRFPGLSWVNRQVIAEASGGNARIAIALAGATSPNDNLAALTDEQLFRRLFLQGRDQDEQLYLTAQVCSLVYSFNGENLSEDTDGELESVGRLVNKSPREIYRDVAELMRRELVQRRGVWRAVLPQAIANRFAALALQNIPVQEVESRLLQSERLMRSFSHRLRYMHSSAEAVAIATKWLAPGGLLEDVAHLNDLGQSVFRNIAPVVPAGVLSALERAITRDPKIAGDCAKYVDLLAGIAYDAELFDRAIALLAAILLDQELAKASHGSKAFGALFHICYSGTLAPFQQRMKTMEALVTSSDPRRQALGILALKEMLEAWEFLPSSNFEFGTRPRDFGYWPRTTAEIQHWFSTVLEFAKNIACGEGHLAFTARAVLVEKFQGLWYHAEVPDHVAAVCNSIRASGFWPQGWRAVRHALETAGEPEDAAGLARMGKLKAIEKNLRPSHLVEEIRGAVFSDDWESIDSFELSDDCARGVINEVTLAEALARNLGAAASNADDLHDTLLAEAVISEGMHLWHFGEGLALGAKHPDILWDRLIEALEKTPDGQRRFEAMRGFLSALSGEDPKLSNTLLDASVAGETLAAYYPFLQSALPIEEGAIHRLLLSLDIGKAPLNRYRSLTCGRVTANSVPDALGRLLLAIAQKASAGVDVALEILSTRIHSDLTLQSETAPALINVGRRLLEQFEFKSTNDRADYPLATVVSVCFADREAAKNAEEICKRFKDLASARKTHVYHYDDFLVAVFRVQPIAALNGFFRGGREDLQSGSDILGDLLLRKAPLSGVPQEDLIRWCDEQPEARYLALAPIIPMYRRTDAGSPFSWCDVAIRFLQKAPNPGEILEVFVARFRPRGGWSGSLAQILESHLPLLDQLAEHSRLGAAIADQRDRLQKWIEDERRCEVVRSRKQDERFE